MVCGVIPGIGLECCLRVLCFLVFFGFKAGERGSYLVRVAFRRRLRWWWGSV